MFPPCQQGVFSLCFIRYTEIIDNHAIVGEFLINRMNLKPSIRLPFLKSYGGRDRRKLICFGWLSSRNGSALVVILLFLVLMAGIILAFFSLAITERTISSSSAANAEADLLANSVVNMIANDFLREIKAGSEEDTFSSPGAGPVGAVYQPLLTTNGPVPLAPSMVPQRVVGVGASGDAPKNLIKESLRTRKFFSSKAGYRPSTDFPEGAVRAAAVSTTERSLKGPAVAIERWQKPQLITETEWASFVAPDWIYLDRRGMNPTAFGESDLKTMASRGGNNERHVIGRYAYAIYDMGGLIDINVVGNTLSADENHRRGRLHQVSLKDAQGSLSIPNFSDLVAWRSAGEPVIPESAGGLFDPKRSFIPIKPGSQTFVSRQDLLQYTVSGNSLIPVAALPFLTTFSRALNAPHFAPDPNRPALPVDVPPQAELNPVLTSIRFPGATTLDRGDEPPITVPAGTPVMVRRFPLSKLGLFEEANPDPAALEYYFGLKRTGSAEYEYTKVVNGGIANLGEVAALKREPNFFEVLQAVMLTGSLGKHGGDTYTFDDARDERRDLQILQIGANIIDQWDSNDIPTTLHFPSGNSGEWLDLYGVENLPYINNMLLTAHHPEFDLNRLRVWALFDVWNPHQNALTPPKGIQAFRIHPKSGAAKMTLTYAIYVPNPANPASMMGWAPLATSVDILRIGSNDLVTELNAGRELSFEAFPSPLGYSEPKIIGGTSPMLESDTPGLLLADMTNVPPAVPKKSERTATVQKVLNTLMDTYFPYTAANSATDDNVTGNRVYPAGTSFTGLNETYWSKTETVSGTTIFAKFGVKAHNLCWLLPALGDPLVFELQIQTSEGWRTYQVVDGLHNPYGGNLVVGIQNREVGPGDFLTSTHHTEASATRAGNFYPWLPDGGETNLGMVKMDPRSIRFGHSYSTWIPLGKTPRMTSSNWNGAISNSPGWRTAKWQIVYSVAPGVLNNGVTGYDFQLWQPNANGLAWLLPSGFVSNIPEGSLSTLHPARYKDRDGVIRPGDGYLGALPTVTSRLKDRALILNRPFRSVGELGYVFRDLPWKTLDFFSRQSGDLGLLDVFTLDQTYGGTPLVAGKVNLNTPHSEVLSAVLAGTANGLNDLANVPDPGNLTSAQASELAEAIVVESSVAPFRDRGDLVRRVLAPVSATTPAISPANIWQPVSKTARESAIRTLAEIGDTRTWNVMIDLVVQPGSFTQASKTGADFSVQAERRYWIHLAIDRITGEVIDQQLEVVHE